MLPFVVILDLDHTIIGDTPQAQRDAHDAVRKLQIAGRLPLDHGRYLPVIDIAMYIKDTGLRPGFVTFIEALRHHIPRVELFIYTNTAEAYAYEKVQAVEQVARVWFNRPIFCGKTWMVSVPSAGRAALTQLKSLRLVLPEVARCLLSKYPALGNPGALELMLHSHTLFIDDTADNLADVDPVAKGAQLLVEPFNTVTPRADARMPPALRNHPVVLKICRAFTSIQERYTDRRPSGADDHLWVRLAAIITGLPPGTLPTAAVIRGAVTPKTKPRTVAPKTAARRRAPTNR